MTEGLSLRVTAGGCGLVRDEDADDVVDAVVQGDVLEDGFGGRGE